MYVKVKTLFYSNAAGKFPYTWYVFKSKAKKHKYAYEKKNKQVFGLIQTDKHHVCAKIQNKFCSRIALFITSKNCYWALK